jgi:formamidopyrimidine-DNA glycosylase
MVEGPKVVIKVQRIQCLKGQCLQAMIVAPSMNSSQPLTTVMKKCIGMSVHRVWSLGKELFLTMAHKEIGSSDIIATSIIGIRLHFGMAGSERLIQTNSLIPGYHLQNLHVVASSMLPKHSRKKWDACLIFNNQSLFVYDSSLSTRTSQYLESAYNSLELDVMSYDKFSIDSTIRQIRASDQSRHIHEVVMVSLGR